MVLSRVFLEHAESIIFHSCLVKRDHVVADEAGQWHSTVSQFLVIPSGMPLKRQLVMGRLCMEKLSVWVWCSSLELQKKGLDAKRGISQKIEEMCQKFGLPVTYGNWDKKPFIKP